MYIKPSTVVKRELDELGYQGKAEDNHVSLYTQGQTDCKSDYESGQDAQERYLNHVKFRQGLGKERFDEWNLGYKHEQLNLFNKIIVYPQLRSILDRLGDDALLGAMAEIAQILIKHNKL